MPYIDEKLAVVAIFGSMVAGIGIVLNALSVYILTRPLVRVSHILYLAVLSLLEIWLLLSYIMLFSVQIIFDWTDNMELYKSWLEYCIPIYCISKMIQIACTYLIVAATLERYLALQESSSRFQSAYWNQRQRVYIIATILIGSFVFKLSSCWEFEVRDKPWCSGFAASVLEMSSLAQNHIYYIVVMFYMSHFVRVFFPFIALIYLNIAIVCRLRRHVKQALCIYLEHTFALQSAPILVPSRLRKHSLNVRRRRQNLRSATRMLVAIVTSHILTHALGFTLTVVEHVDMRLLQSSPKFYTFAVDLINLLSVINSTIRFPIYYMCNRQIREEVQWLLGRRRQRKRYKPIRRKKTTQMDTMLSPTSDTPLLKRQKSKEYQEKESYAYTDPNVIGEFLPIDFDWI